MDTSRAARPLADTTAPTTLTARRLATAVVQLAAAACLAIDAVVHLQDADSYAAVQGTLISEATLFRVQAVVALAVAVLVLAHPRPWVWVVAAVVTGSAVAAVTLSTYVDIGAIAGLPDLYEPSWVPPGKLASAVAEGAGLLVSLVGLVLSLRRPRPSSV